MSDSVAIGNPANRQTIESSSAGLIGVTSLAILLIVGMAWWSACELTDRAGVCLDDAFITYIYSRNLADGHGLLYNVTDARPTEGYSSPLHVLLTGAAMRAGIEPLAFTRGMSLVLLLTIPIALAWSASRASIDPESVAASSARRCWGLIAALLLLILLCLPETMGHVTTGLETYLFASICAWIFAWSVCILFSDRPPGVAGSMVGVILMVLLALARPEGVVLACGYLIATRLAIGVAGRWSVAHRRCFVWMSVAYAVILGGYLVWKWAYFGYLLPNPYYTKAHNEIFGTAGNVLPGVSEVVRFTVFRIAPVLALIVAVRGFAPRPAEPSNARPPSKRGLLALALLLLPSLGVVLLYSRAIHEVAGGFRYEYPHLLPWLGVLVIVMVQRGLDKPRKALAVFAVVLAGKLLFSGADSSLLHRLRNPVQSALAWTDYRHEDDPLAAMGLDLAETGLESDGRILLSGAGLTAYYSRFTALDWVGLNSNELSGREALSVDEVWGVIEEFNPDVIYSILPPATRGASDRTVDPAFASPSVRRTLNGRASELFKQWNPDRVADMFYHEMQYVRDHCVFGAAYGFDGVWGDDWALFAYVRRDSPHRDVILKVLRNSARSDQTTNFAPFYVNDPRELKTQVDG